MFALQEALANVLESNSDSSRQLFRVAIRVYHGWHRGKTKTQDRIDLEQVAATASLGRKIGRVSFEPELQFGDVLLCESRRCPLYDTLRRRDDDAPKDEQKMVDTALVSDLLHLARTQRERLAVVVGDDDDLLPGAFVAESWRAKVLVARFRKDDNSHIDTRNLVVRMRSE